jgi:hypothetical protein
VRGAQFRVRASGLYAAVLYRLAGKPLGRSRVAARVVSGSFAPGRKVDVSFGLLKMKPGTYMVEIVGFPNDGGFSMNRRAGPRFVVDGKRSSRRG